MDDCRQFLRPLLEGWRWTGHQFEYSKQWEDEDLVSGLTDQQRTMRELIPAMSSLLSFIRFEGEISEMFSDNRLPTLDTAIWVCEHSGRVEYSFFEKPTVPNRMVQKDTALNENSLRASLVQEVIRRMKCCSENVSVDEKQLILSKMAQKMINGGHSLASTQLVLVHGIVKLNEMIRNSKLDPTQKNYKPLHSESTYDRFNRKLQKMIAK